MNARHLNLKDFSRVCNRLFIIKIKFRHISSVWGRLTYICSNHGFTSNKAKTLPIKLHTHIYIIGHYNASVRIINLASHTTCVGCVNFIHKWRDLQYLKSTPKDRFFWETFHGNCICFQSFCQKSVDRKYPKKYVSYFVLMSGLGLESWLYV